MKNLTKSLALAVLMSSGLVQAALPADISSSPGVLLVNWHNAAPMDSTTPQKLEVRDDSGAVLASVHPEMTGTQYVRIPHHAQGNLMVSLGDNSSAYRIPYGMGEGRQR